MATTTSLFSATKTPQLFDQLQSAARSGLESSPIGLKPLLTLAEFLEFPRCDFSETYPIALKVLADGQLGEVRVKAEDYTQKFAAFERDVNKDLNCVKERMEALAQAHLAFREKYVEKLEQVSPFEPFCILKNYPRTLNLFLTAWTLELKKAPRETFLNWKQSARESSEVLIPTLCCLAVLRLLEKTNLQLPELLEGQEEEISDLRMAYKALSKAEKEALHTLCTSDNAAAGHQAQDLFRRISALQYRVERGALNGVLRLAYQEADKYFQMLEDMRPCKAAPFRAVLLSALKQESTPLLLNTSKAQETLGTLQTRFRGLPKAQQEEFEKAFLDQFDNSDNQEVYELLQDAKDLLFFWNERIPSHLLAT